MKVSAFLITFYLLIDAFKLKIDLHFRYMQIQSDKAAGVYLLNISLSCKQTNMNPFAFVCRYLLGIKSVATIQETRVLFSEEVNSINIEEVDDNLNFRFKGQLF